MARILTNEELKKELKVEYSREMLGKARTTRLMNIQAFNGLSRKGFFYNKKEKLILLYETQKNEQVYIQFPGKESIGNPEMKLDFRPKLQDDSGKFIDDLSFGTIWDILDEIGKEHKAYLPYIACIFFTMGYMHNYKEYNKEYKCYEINYKSKDKSIKEIGCEVMNWYGLYFSDDIWYTLNDKIGLIKLESGQSISFEGFIKLVDLLFQNEDCKYYYKNVIINNKKDYKLDNGRLNSSAANLLILNYLEGNVKISNLLNAFQKSRGVPTFLKRDYAVVTDNIVINIDERRK